MEELLTTKLHIPAMRTKLVARPHLLTRLSEGLPRKLTLISAPAGFGKTTLVSEWVHQLQLDGTSGSQAAPIIAWVSLDEGDNDPTRFIAYLITALNQAAGPKVTLGTVAMRMLDSHQPNPAGASLTSLINELTATPSNFLLVLDDYHLIESESIHNAISYLLEHLPPSVHLVIATREDPDLPLARLRAQNVLTELRAADLRFASSEAAILLNQVMDLNLSTEEITALETRTEGWITGLQLAAISMQGREDTDHFIQSFTGSHRYVLDYLIEEVLERQPTHVQNFLQQTAILDRLSGDLCDAIVGENHQQETLEYLEHANLFIVSLDEERHWYRYHHLFADFLRQQMLLQPPGILKDLHVRASAWFKRKGFHREAIKHSLAAKDYSCAAGLIEDIAIDMIQEGKHTTITGWIDALPDNLVRELPYLCVLHAWALHLAGEMEQAHARLVGAERALHRLRDPDDSEVDIIRGLIHSQQAYRAFMSGELDKTIQHAQQALVQLPEDLTSVRTRTSTYQAAAHLFLGQLEAALEVYNQVLPTIPIIGGTSTATMCLSGLGDLHVDIAQLGRAKDTYQQALDCSERYNGRPDVPFTGFVYVRIGRILRQRNHLEDAHRFVAKGLSLCREWNVSDVVALSCIELSYIHSALGNEEQSRHAISEALHIMKGFSPFGTQHAAAHQAINDLRRGDLDSADHWAQANDLVLDGDFQYHREIEYLALARLQIVQKQWKEAISLVERVFQIAKNIGKRQTELEALVLLALIYFGQGQRDEAFAHLEQALDIGEPEGYVRIFVDEGPRMARLLFEAASRGIKPGYVQRLLTAFPIPEHEPPGSLQTRSPETGLFEPLSGREIEVLQLIAEGLTNQEIAARLYLSLNTVKVHARNIYGKLGVNNRVQAGARARALGLIPTN